MPAVHRKASLPVHDSAVAKCPGYCAGTRKDITQKALPLNGTIHSFFVFRCCNAESRSLITEDRLDLNAIT